MRILLIHNFYRYYGGEDAYYSSLTTLLKKKGHKVLIFTRNNKDIGNDIASKFNTARTMLWNTEIKSKLSETILAFKPDVAQFQNIYPLITPITYRVCKEYNIPIIQRISNFRLVCAKGTLFRDNKICELCPVHNNWLPAVINRCYQNSYPASFSMFLTHTLHKILKSYSYIDRYIFTSEFVRNYYLEHYLDISEEKTIVIPQFASDQIINDTIIKRKDYFLFVGRFSEEKGILPLLNLFSKTPSIKLIAIGDGPLLNDVMNYKKYKNIIIKTFLKREKVYQYMKKAQAVLIPSLNYDTLPNVLIESFKTGTPVVVPFFGPFTDLVQGNRTGYFYQYNNFEDLRDKLINLSKSQETIHMEKKIIKEFYDKYSQEQHYHSLIKLYNEAIQRKSNINIPIKAESTENSSCQN